MADNSYDRGTGIARAFLGQGLGLGWGDEAEAWLRSKLGDSDYEQNLGKIRREYGQYAGEHPVESALAEFGGGAAPAVAAMFLPGGQAAAAPVARSGIGALAKLAAMGAGTGAVSGAGTAEQDRLSGALAGGVLGGTIGAATPMALRGGSAALQWLRQRAMPTEAGSVQFAARKLLDAIGQDNMAPADIRREVTRMQRLGVPGVVSNVSSGASDLAEAVAQRTGRGARIIEKGLGEQKAGARERVYQQTTRGLKGGNYYADEQRLVEDLRRKASTLYDQAYAHGTVDDPRINEVLKNSTFAGFFNKAKSIAEKEALAEKLRGGDPSKFALREIYDPIYVNDPQTGLPVLQGFNLREAPDVRTLDYIKRGIDASIDSGFRGEGMSKAEASALRDLRRLLVGAIDENVPDYAAARKAYAGDMEVIDAMRAGMNDFGKLDHEQVQQMVQGMTPSELMAFRTGVVRDLYGRIMGPTNNINAARRIIGSPEMRQKLEPLFETPAKFKLFKSALEKEAQLFAQANKVLAGSQTGKRAQLKESLESGSEISTAVADAVRGGFFTSLGNLAARAVSNTTMTDDMAEKLATMLMAKNPVEVAAVVKILETQAAADIPRAFRAGAVERAVATGTPAAVWAPPAAGGRRADAGSIEEPDQPALGGPNIEADLATPQP